MIFELLSLLPLVSSVFSCSSALPGGKVCPQTGFAEFPDPDNCAFFYQCSHGCAERVECQVGFLYDVNHHYCNYADQVDCGNRPCVDPQRCPQDVCDHPMDCTDMADGWYADPYNCRKYTHCLGGKGEHLTCRDNLLFEPNKIWCDYPANVDCGDRPICDDCDENCETPPTKPPSECTHVCTSDGYFPEGCCSNNFCVCEGGHGNLMHCQPGLIYNEVNMWCDYPANVPCCNA